MVEGQGPAFFTCYRKKPEPVEGGSHQEDGRKSDEPGCELETDLCSFSCGRQVRAPFEAAAISAEILGHGDDGIRESPLQSPGLGVSDIVIVVDPL